MIGELRHIYQWELYGCRPNWHLGSTYVAVADALFGWLP